MDLRCHIKRPVLVILIGIVIGVIDQHAAIFIYPAQNDKMSRGSK